MSIMRSLTSLRKTTVACFAVILCSGSCHLGNAQPHNLQTSPSLKLQRSKAGPAGNETHNRETRSLESLQQIEIAAHLAAADSKVEFK